MVAFSAYWLFPDYWFEAVDDAMSKRETRYVANATVPGLWIEACPYDSTPIALAESASNAKMLATCMQFATGRCCSRDASFEPVHRMVLGQGVADFRVHVPNVKIMSLRA